MVNSYSILIIIFLIVFINSNQNIANSEINLLAKKKNEKKLVYLSPENRKLELSGKLPFTILVSICDFNNLVELSYTTNNTESRYRVPYKKSRKIEFKSWDSYSSIQMNSLSIRYNKSEKINDFAGAELIYSFTYNEDKKIHSMYQLNLTIKSNKNIINWEPVNSKGNVIYELYLIQNNKTFLNNSCYLNFLKTKYKKNKKKLNNDEEKIEFYDLKKTNFTMKTKEQFFIQIVAHVEEEDILYRMKYNAISKEIYYESYNWFYFTLPLVFFGLLFLMIVLLNQKGSDNNYVPLDKNLNNEFISNIIDKSDSNNIK
jgi:hypothetical protein